MRLWNVNTSKMCRQHLLGEHFEMHMFAGSIIKGISMKGYIDKGLVQLGHIKSRHDSLALEMLKRGYNHNSPLKQFEEGESEKVNMKANEEELHRRCKECKF